MAEQRLPIVNSDDGTWGTILNQYLEKEHYNTGIDDASNGMHKTITIRAGTATAGTAPLKFNSGTVLSSPEAGCMEFTTDSLFFTITTGPARKTIAWTDFTNISGTLGITNGGTGQTTAVAAFDALAPTTTQGDTIYHNGTDNVRLAKGTGLQVYRMNSGATAPEWTNPNNIYGSDYTHAFLLGGM